MPMVEILCLQLGTRLAKLLLRAYLGVPGEMVGADLVDIAKHKISDLFEGREAKRQFESIGERVAERMTPLFEKELNKQQVNVEAVILELGRTLAARGRRNRLARRLRLPGSLDMPYVRGRPLAFIEKWHEAVAAEFSRLGKPDDGAIRRCAEQLKVELAGNQDVARLALNPLLCAMICALHRDQDKKLPASLVDLCEALCQILLQLDHEKELPEFPEEYRNLSYPQRRAIVSELAYWMLINGEPSISTVRAKSTITDVLRFFPGHSPAHAWQICKSLVERSGMLREINPGLSRLHPRDLPRVPGRRTHCGLRQRRPVGRECVAAHMAAGRPVRRRDIQPGARNRGELPPTRWQAGEKRPSCGARAPQGSLAARPALPFDRIVVGPGTRGPAGQVTQSMCPPRNMAEAEAVATLGGRAIPWLYRRQGLETAEAVACVRALNMSALRKRRCHKDLPARSTRARHPGAGADPQSPDDSQGAQGLPRRLSTGQRRRKANRRPLALGARAGSHAVNGGQEVRDPGGQTAHLSRPGGGSC